MESCKASSTSWIQHMLRCEFFSPCPTHLDQRKAEVRRSHAQTTLQGNTGPQCDALARPIAARRLGHPIRISRPILVLRAQVTPCRMCLLLPPPLPLAYLLLLLPGHLFLRGLLLQAPVRPLHGPARGPQNHPGGWCAGGGGGL